MTQPGETPAAASSPAAGVARYGAVLVPLDGSDLAERALAPAHWLAERFDAAVHLLGAGVSRDEAWWYQRHMEGVTERLAGASVHLSDDRDIAGTILATARDLDPCLVCMATHGRSRSAAIVGSTFADVAARGGAPLLAVGPRAVPPAEDAPSGIVVCLDGDPLAEQALPVAAAWARRLGTGVVLVTATDPVLLPRDEADAEGPYGPEHDPGAYLEEVAGRPVFEGLTVEVDVLWGLAVPHVAIGEKLDRTPGALAVATSHARRGLARAALGSEVANIIRRSPAPVLVQPARG